MLIINIVQSEMYLLKNVNLSGSTYVLLQIYIFFSFMIFFFHVNYRSLLFATFLSGGMHAFGERFCNWLNFISQVMISPVDAK